MKKEPNINKEKLKNLIEKNYLFKISSLKFIPKGEDADSYIITTKRKKKFFLKIYDLKKIKRLNLKIHFESFNILNLLHTKENITKISYPILTKQDKSSLNLKNRRMIIFNYIAGKNDEKKLTKKQLENLAILMARVHKSPLKKQVKHKEQINLTYLKKLKRLITQTKWAKTPFQKKIQKKISENRLNILNFIEETIKISKKIKLSEKDRVIVHSDPYFLNIIKRKEDIYLIDWDGIQLAPKEKDIWFYLTKGICTTPFVFLNKYKEIYGNYRLNKNIVHYYIYNRVLEDLYSYLEEVIFGREEEKYFKEINEYCLDCILDIKKILGYIDGTIDRWNRR